MILYTENPKISNKKLLQLINKFCKVAGYNVSIQKSLAFLYNNNELLGKETKKTPFTITSKNKIPRNKFNQGCEEPVPEKL